MPRKTVVVVVILVVSVRRSAKPEGQLRSSIITTPTVPNPIRWTQVVIPLSNVQLDPFGGVIGGSAAAEAGTDGRALHTIGVDRTAVTADRLAVGPEEFFDVGAGVFFGEVQDVLALLRRCGNRLLRCHAQIIGLGGLLSSA